MPQLLLPVSPPRPARRAAHIDPSADLFDLCEATWIIVQLDADAVRDQMHHITHTHTRIERGDVYVTDHPEDAPAAARLARLRRRLDRERAACNQLERICWFHCVELHGLIANSGPERRRIERRLLDGPVDGPETVWRRLLPERDPPELVYVDNCLVVPARPSSVAAWERDGL